MSLDWQRVGQFYYRVRDVYIYPSNLGRSEVIDSKRLLNSSSSIIAVCPLAGPIAVIEKTGKNRLIIFTPDYRILSEVDLDLSNSIVGVWWNLPDPELIVLTSDGSLVRVLQRPQHLIERKTVTKLPITERIVGVAVADKLNPINCVVLTESMTFYEINIDSISLTRFPSLPKMLSPIVCFVAISSGRIVASVESGSLILIDTKASTVLVEDLGAEILALSLSGKFFASYSKDFSINVYSTADIETRSTSTKPIETSILDIGLSPSNLAWIGDDCLSLSFASRDRHVLFIGGVGNTDWSPYEHDSKIHLSSDLNCAFVITSSRFQAIQRVSSSTYAVFGGSSSNEPEAKLLAGYEYFVSNDVRAESTIRSIKTQLEKAVIGCAEAAAWETPPTQKNMIEKLLKASIFGRQFLTNSSTTNCSSIFVNSAGLIRVSSCLSDIGIPISVAQLMSLGSRGCSIIVHFLTARGEYLLAKRIGQWLGMSVSDSRHIFNLWAIDLVSSSLHLPDRDICGLITSRMDPGQPLTRIAEYAYKQANRKNLATNLLQFEQDTTEQVKLLLALGSDEMAVQKALSSGDIDLVHHWFDSIIKNQKNIQSIISTSGSNISDIALMLSLIQFRYYSEHKYEDLCKLLQTIPGTEFWLADASMELARSKTKQVETASLSKAEEVAEWIQYSAERFSECVTVPTSSLFNSPIGCQFTASLLAESSQLLIAQVGLEKTAIAKGWPRGPHKFIGLSLDETLRKLVSAGEVGEAETLRTKRKMSDGRWWDLRMNLHMTCGKIEEGITFVNKVPPPSQDCRGYKGVVEILLSMAREDLVLPFIKKLKPKKQVKIYNQLGLFEDARLAEQRSGSIVGSVPGVGLLGKLAGGLIGR